jgi:hypothetical protein
MKDQSLNGWPPLIGPSFGALVALSNKAETLIAINQQ